MKNYLVSSVRGLNIKALALFALALVVGISSGFAQEADPTYLEELTTGLDSVFSAFLTVIVPILLTGTAIVWFLKFRSKA